ncbi:MAG: hypothetical protein QOE14_3059 [Humisphaera sp.]|nr:hypothetical protein [Humisphaera sp.]
MKRLFPILRAFTLTELLIAIGDLGLFGAAAGKVLHATMRVGYFSALQQDEAGSFDSAAGALRDDAWSAAEMAAPNPQTAKLGKIIWTIDDTKLTRDAGDAAPRRSWTVPSGVTFAVDGPALVLRVPAKPGERSSDVRMVSEAILLSRLSS